MENSKHPLKILLRSLQRWQDTMLSLEKEYEQEPEVLKIGGVPIGTLGNFSASIGKAKSKKTFNVSAMVAAALSGRKSLTTQRTSQKERTASFTLTQSRVRNHCMIVMHRIMKTGRVAGQ